MAVMQVIYEQASGDPIGFKQDNGSDSSLPEELGVITVEELPENLAEYRVVDGELVSLTQTQADQKAASEIDADKATAAFEVNRLIGKLRRAFATETAFQAQAYLNKRAEAEAYLALTPPPATLDAFPLLKELTVARGMSAADLAQLWLDTNNEWTPVLNQTEILRDSTVFAINSATNRAEIDAAVAAFNTALNAISTPGDTP